MIPFRSLLMIASSDDAMIAARKFFAVSVNTVGLPKTLAVSGFFKWGRLRTLGCCGRFAGRRHTAPSEHGCSFPRDWFCSARQKSLGSDAAPAARASLPIEYQNVRLAPPR